MSRQACGHGHFRNLGMRADIEVLVVTHRIKADVVFERPALDCRQALPQERLDSSSIRGIHDAWKIRRVAKDRLPTTMLSQLQAHSVNGWEAVEDSSGAVEQENRAT